MRCTLLRPVVLAVSWAVGAPVQSAITTTGDVDPLSTGVDPWVISAEMWIGNAANGELSVTDGSTVSNTFGRLGRLSGSIGTATITGSGTTWTNSQALNVGDGGEGTLAVNAGGMVSSSSGTIGLDDVAVGDVEVAGDDSTWTNSGSLVVANRGSGELTVTSGGNVFNADGTVGLDVVSKGAVTVTGENSIWTNSIFLTVGQLGTGTLNVEDGGSVEDPTGTLGFNAGSIGSAVVTGAGSTWSNTGPLNVGNFGTGELTIEDGGSVDNTSGRIGVNSDSSGTVTVSGAGSSWTNSLNLLVGESGDGTLAIEDGGTVSNFGGRIGFGSGSTGTVTVTGEGSTWDNDTDGLRIGLNGTGSLTITNGGSVLDDFGNLGVVAGSSGTATVSGAGSTWTNSSQLTVGNAAVGSLLIEAGGYVSNTDGVIGRFPESTGTVVVTGTGSTWTNSANLHIGNSENVESATLEIDTGGTVTVAGETVLFTDGILRLNGGTLATTEFRFDGGGEFEWTSGTLHIERYKRPLLNQAGTLAPGWSAGSTTIIGQYTQQADGVLEIEIGGHTPGTDFDVLTIEPLLSSDDALLDGTLDVALIDKFVPALGSTFTIVETTAGNVIGTFAEPILPIFDGLTFEVIYNAQSVVLQVIEAGLPGDYNQNGVVDAADYTVWRDNLGAAAGTLPNDTAGGVIGTDQYELWNSNFGQTAGSGAAAIENGAVPEPTTLVLFLGAIAALCWHCRTNAPQVRECARRANSPPFFGTIARAAGFSVRRVEAAQDEPSNGT